MWHDILEPNRCKQRIRWNSWQNLPLSHFVLGSTSTYENMAEISRSQFKQSQSNYVNIQEYRNNSDLNYADLDFTLPKPTRVSPANKISANNRNCRSATPTKLSNGKDVDNDSQEDAVEYTLINIAATEAARLACAEHQEYRQRHLHLPGST